MITNHTKESLTAFSERVKQAFLEKRIKAPVHLCSPDQAEPLIEFFKDVRPQDWLCSNWRSMWHCLLKGLPEDELFQMILEGRSMYIFSKEHRILCSSIVGGILPIAAGLALGAKRLGLDECVYVCAGDMTSKTGLFHEFVQYCQGHELPVKICIEDNNLSTNTPTDEVWGTSTKPLSIMHYIYQRTEPHVGLSEYVQF